MNRRVSSVGLIVCGLLSTMLGCEKGTDDPGTGGASSGGAASNDAGAAGDSPISIDSTCRGGVTAPPVSALITDFSDATPDPAHSGDFLFGGSAATRNQGYTVRYSNSARDKGTLSLSNSKLGFSATVDAPTASGPGEFPFSGFALVIGNIGARACVDASAYTGVSFDLEGDLGGCILYLSFAYADDLATSADPYRGLCSGTCYPSEYAITTDTTSVSFADAQTVPGVPVAPINVQQLAGVQWQVAAAGTTSCTASFTVANVKFE